MHNHPQEPRILLIPFNAVTSFQILNAGVLAWWAIMIYVHRDAYAHSHIFESFKLAPAIEWWIVASGLIFLVNILPMLRFWALRVNHSYRTKTVGMSLSVGWWVFIASAFLFGQGIDLGFGIHAALAIACMYETVNLSRHWV